MRSIVMSVAMALVLLLVAGGTARGAGSTPQPLVPKPRGAAADGQVDLTFDGRAYLEIKDRPTLTLHDFALPGGSTAILSLRRVEVFAPGARVVLGSSDGDRALPMPDVACFAGEIVGAAGSRVFLSFSPHGSNGYLKRGERTFIVSSGGAAGNSVIFDPAMQPTERAELGVPVCGGGALARPGGDEILARVEGARKAGVVESLRGSRGSCTAIEIAIETDYEFTVNLFAGSTAAAGAYAATLMAAVSSVYEPETGFAYQISYLRLWATDVDPYFQNDAFDLLYAFRDEWNLNQAGVHRDIAHMLSERSLSSAGGVAWLWGVCEPLDSGEGYGYGLSGHLNGTFPMPRQTLTPGNWDFMVVAHELGHSCGAIHTHEMVPPVDNCGNGDCSQAFGGTIMSYCHTCAGGTGNIDHSLHPRLVNENILPFLLTTSCGLTVPPPACDGDADASTVVDFGDITSTLANWGSAGPLGDGNHDGAVNFQDITVELANWGAACECP